MKVARRVTVPEISVFALIGVLLSSGFAVALVITLWVVFGAVPALVVGLVLSVAATVAARAAEQESFAQAQSRAVQQQPRFRDPEDQED